MTSEVIDKNFDVNIIILTHNNLSYTKSCLQALYENTVNFGLIIVDNGSDEETTSFLKRQQIIHDNIVVKFNNSNKGVIRGRNMGYEQTLLSLMGSYYTVFLDNDQFVQPGWTDHYYKMMEDGYDIVGVEAWEVRTDFYPIRKLQKYSDDAVFHYIGCGGMMIKSFIISEMGLFDDRFSPMYFEDPDFCFRAYGLGYKIGWNSHKKVVHAPHKLLGNTKRKGWFLASWKKFQDKWQGASPPIIKLKSG